MDTGDAPTRERSPTIVLRERYALGKVLGRGAFATSFLGEDLFLARPIVIKVLDQGQAEDLFQRETRITASMSHPNIVNVLDAGTTKDGRPYFVTEWIEGRDLHAVLSLSGPLGTKKALQIGAGIAEALAYIHSRNFVHRDLKPSNILIPGWPSNPDYRNPKVLDFGVAGLLWHGHTAPGMMFGTPQYMSPEQVLGEPQSPATDVYGWALLFFEMLAGHPLRSRADRAELLFRDILEEGSAEGEFEAIPAEFASLVRSCVRRRPEERPSIDTILEALGRAEVQAIHLPEVQLSRSEGEGRGTPTLAQSTAVGTMAAPLSIGARATTWFARRKRLLATAVGLAFVALVIAFIELHGPLRALAFWGGLLLIVGSIPGAFWLRYWLGRRSSEKEQAYELALGAKARVNLTETIALQLDDLVYRLRGLDQRILAGSVALMLDEYGRATDCKDRQAALMNVVSLSEKLAQRLSPWYVRYKEVIASAVAVLGALSGLLTAINALRGVHKP